jgi:hypothetical protein
LYTLYSAVLIYGGLWSAEERIKASIAGDAVTE